MYLTFQAPQQAGCDQDIGLFRILDHDKFAQENTLEVNRQVFHSLHSQYLYLFRGLLRVTFSWLDMRVRLRIVFSATSPGVGRASSLLRLRGWTLVLSVGMLGRRKTRRRKLGSMKRLFYRGIWVLFIEVLKVLIEIKSISKANSIPLNKNNKIIIGGEKGDRKRSTRERRQEWVGG